MVDLQQTYEEIRFTKERQWHTAYLTLLFFAAITGFFQLDIQLSHGWHRGLKIAAWVVVGIIWVISIFFQYDHYKSLNVYRIALRDDEKTTKEKKWKSRIYTGCFMFLSTLAAVATSFAVHFDKP